MSIRISEIFGPTVQGEGPLIGTLTTFIRTQGCNYRCAWCDTKYAQPEDQGIEMSIDEIVRRISDIRQGTRWVTISGGNPALQDLEQLVKRFHQLSLKVAVETQGSHFPYWLHLCDKVVISPKGPSSGQQYSSDILDAMVDTINCDIKVVVSDYRDVQFVEQLVKRYKKYIYVQPCSTDENTIKVLCDLVEVFQETKFDGRVILLPQLHVLMYHGERGR